MNSWDDQNVRDALAANGRKKVIVSGLWTEVCNTTFALCAAKEGIIKSIWSLMLLAALPLMRTNMPSTAWFRLALFR